MLERCNMLERCDMLQGCNRYFVQPTIIETSNPKFTTMCSELFGPVLTVHVYDEVCSAVGAVRCTVRRFSAVSPTYNVMANRAVAT